jgi:hypothetical protein
MRSCATEAEMDRLHGGHEGTSQRWIDTGRVLAVGVARMTIAADPMSQFPPTVRRSHRICSERHMPGGF